jgi:hypothetical protein
LLIVIAQPVFQRTVAMGRARSTLLQFASQCSTKSA